MSGRWLIYNKLLWILDTRCNLNCPHCYVHSREWEKKLTRERSLELIEEAKEMGIKEIDFSGGEVLLIPETMDYLQKAKESGLSVSLNSNGLLLNEKNLRRLKELDVFLYLSIDGAKKETYEKIRGLGHFDLLLTNLSLLQKFEIPFAFLFTLSSINYFEAPEMVSLGKEWGAKFLCLIPLIPAGEARKSRIWIDSSLIVDTVKEVSEAADKFNFPVHVADCPFLKLFSFSNNLIIEPCPSFEIIDLSPSGDILICDVVDFPFSEVRTKSLLEAIKEMENHPLYNLLKERKKACEKCSVSDFCQAGCYARAYLCLGDFAQPDPFCPQVLNQS
ncbi:MAG: radical SAM protein [Candidatus Aminicenantes bacterium]|nr:radical SAM protein [Candidatus Aminicenantes bacterium]